MRSISDYISQRALGVDASGIRKVFDLAAKMKDPINLSIGLPDFDVPDVAKTFATLHSRPLLKNCQDLTPVSAGKNKKRQMNAYDPDATRIEFMEPNTPDGVPAPSSTLPLPAYQRKTRTPQP